MILFIQKEFLLLSKINANVMRYEECKEELWDYVSSEGISDTFWEQNPKFINTLTGKVLKEVVKEEPKAKQFQVLKTCGVLLNIVFTTLNSYKLLKNNDLA